MLSRHDVVEGLKKVVDPELNMDIYTLGLIYDIRLEGRKVLIRMTLTSPACPYGPQMMAEVRKEMRKLGLEPEIDMVFEPPWEPSEEVRDILGVA